jgi:uncharacterized protein (DUF1015 family)
MATVHPFKAWRPSPNVVEEISSLPYDVISTSEARKAAKDNPSSFLHVIRPEIDLPEGTPFNDEAVYQKGAGNLQRFMDEGLLKQEEESALYIYRLIWNGRTQTGIFGCVSVADYDDDVILKHELTRPAKEDDRTRHIVTQQAHAEPVMLTCKDQADIQAFTADFCRKKKPLFDFTVSDGITHRLWKVANAGPLIHAFENLEHLYIADGHHRCKSASRAAGEEREKHADFTGAEEFNYFPAVIFPMNEMNILPYNRVVFSVPDHFREQLEQHFTVREDADPVPGQKGEICLYLDSSWLQITLPEDEDPSAAEQLDVYRLQEFILEPMLGIEDPRRDDNISFVGGIRGTEALENRVDSGEADLAVSMYPTAIEELVQVSDEGLLMPPKSTWFEPKLRSGLLVHSF